ncbi:MAG: helix-turn-helix domain-containing protein [Azoarcus sp.]|jgi:transcriptional regulator with XRE-family HTH domain|nr:helix-turn-helix domain-containing protein [Azoarcus sp.]
MSSTTSPLRNPETLALLGGQLRRARERAGLAQGKAGDMRQGTVSRIENGHDVTLDTFVSYATALGLEIALVPIGRAATLGPAPEAVARPMDLLEELSDLADEE